MEIIHTTEDNKFQFLRDNDRYTVVQLYRVPSRWLSPCEMIAWTLMPATSPVFKEIDRFILNYFPESLVTLAALENS